jgi:hypothetical protein
VTERLADNEPFWDRGLRQMSDNIGLYDLQRSAQLDALEVDKEVEAITADNFEPILDYFRVDDRYKEYIKMTMSAIISLLSLMKNQQRSIGMSMMKLEMSGGSVQKILYFSGRIFSKYMSLYDPVARKMLDIFNIACFVVFLCTGKYNVIF